LAGVMRRISASKDNASQLSSFHQKYAALLSAFT
jgi:hypothetical protein